jgi:RNA polymerase sigma-70 factor (ECF subfamily)
VTETPANAAKHLVAARAGSQEALGRVLESCRAYLLHIANKGLDPGLKAKGGASDLVQETFLEAQRDFGAFKGDSEKELRAWLRQLLLHNVANFTRRYRVSKRQAAREVGLKAGGGSSYSGMQLAGGGPSPSDEAVASEQKAALLAAIDRLPEDYRRVIILRNQERRSFDEIAEILQRSVYAVRRLWSRAIERLEEELDSPR